MKFIKNRLALVPLLFLAGSSLVNSRDFEYTQAMRKETQTVAFLLENFHYSQKFINQSQAEEFLEGFMEDLDYNHVFLLKKDRDELVNQYAARLERSLRRGELDAAYAIYDRYEQRVLDRIDWILKRLDNPFDFSVDTEYVVDREELPWPMSETDADELWENRLKYEMLFDLLADVEGEDSDDPSDETEPAEGLEQTEVLDQTNQDTDLVEDAEGESEVEEDSEDGPDAVEIVRKRYERLKKNLMDLESVDVQEIFLTTLTKMFDPHSTFLSSDTLEDFSISMSLSLVGIGAILVQEEGYCTIRELIPGGPAELDGRMRPGDRIVFVAQEGEGPVDVIDMKLRKIVKMIRGEKSTTVYLTVIPADAADPSIREVIDIVRDEVKITASRADASVYQLPGAEEPLPIGVIQLPSFYGDLSINEGDTPTSTTKDVEELIGKLEKEGIRGLILDLRRNGGGLLTEAIDLTGLFIKTGPVVQVRNNRGFIRRDWDRDDKIAYNGPLIVLVDRFSASASEIVAGALQYYDRALIVGDKSTHGKGTVQAVFEIDRLASPSFFNDQPTGAAKLTIQKFYLPNGKSTQNKGVISDIPLPSINEFLPIGEADLDHAMPWDEINPVNWTQRKSELSLKFGPIDEPLREQLTALSESRQNNLNEFTWLKETIEFFKEKQDMKSYSLNLEKRQSIRESDKSVREAFEERQEELEKHFYPSEEIELSVVEEGTPMDELSMNDPQSSPDNPNAEELDGLSDDSSLDIHLRESLRILSDWINAQDPTSADTAANLTKAKNSQG
tara:strand:+ start:7733 stop:10093 length:2361 start_codon:yes stop_codon:yes gene_type:complete